VGERYGVHTLRSPPAPEDFDPARQFDMIWVASLFSHLPAGLFGRWLARLAGLLAPGGVLCFSVHDEALLPSDMAVDDGGLLYIAGSENARLDPAIYGTTFVSADYVERAVAAAFGPGARTLRLPRLLAHEQDVYVVTAPDGPQLDTLRPFPRGLRGWLDEMSIDRGRNRVRLEGWAGSMDGEPMRGVEIELDGQVIVQPADRPRPRVAEVLGLPHLARSGFEIEIELPAAPAPWLRLSALAESGERALIYAGRLGDA